METECSDAGLVDIGFLKPEALYYSTQKSSTKKRFRSWKISQRDAEYGKPVD
ncbi:hypothetical protein ACKUB1_17010 [Methanospirillum stamsii]|uniref:hypothetical protein n=1 Tax=Methanospirillum stamsii TaxID=1277351 RepID=UPI0015E8571A|nr:hypothetical protein [Methanospirillum stamsii]